MNLSTVLEQWNIELNQSLRQSRSFCVALYSFNGEMLFANEAFSQLVESYDVLNFINPTFEQLLSAPQQEACIFNGIMTLNSGRIINTSIEAQVYSQDQMLLIVGGANSLELLEQNIKLHNLNKEVSGLERQLIKKNQNLTHLLSEIKDKNTELSHLISDKDLFLQIMAHDLRGPIGSMLRLSEMLCERFADFTSERVELMLETIYKSLDSTYCLLEDLLLWAKAQAGNLPYQPTRVSAKAICDEVNSLYAQNAKAITVQCALPNALYFEADEQMLKTILRNLISNAIKFTAEGGSVVVDVKAQNDLLQFSVKDNGVGMAPSVVSALFDFTKRHTTMGTQGEKGSGLGIQLCADFVKVHGGQMWVESEEGKGTTFYFTIPQKNEETV